MAIVLTASGQSRFPLLYIFFKTRHLTHSLVLRWFKRLLKETFQTTRNYLIIKIFPRYHLNFFWGGSFQMVCEKIHSFINLNWLLCALQEKFLSFIFVIIYFRGQEQRHAHNLRSGKGGHSVLPAGQTNIKGWAALDAFWWHKALPCRYGGPGAHSGTPGGIQREHLGGGSGEQIPRGTGVFTKFLTLEWSI